MYHNSNPLVGLVLYQHDMPPVRIELTTPSLRDWCSATELWRPWYKNKKRKIILPGHPHIYNTWMNCEKLCWLSSLPLSFFPPRIIYPLRPTFIHHSLHLVDANKDYLRAARAVERSGLFSPRKRRADYACPLQSSEKRHGTNRALGCVIMCPGPWRPLAARRVHSTYTVQLFAIHRVPS